MVNYYEFLKLDRDQRNDTVMENGDYLGMDDAGKDVYALFGFWVLVGESRAGERTFRATRTEPDY